MKIKFIQKILDSMTGKNRYINLVKYLEIIYQDISTSTKQLENDIQELSIKTQQLEKDFQEIKDIKYVNDYLNITNAIDFSVLGQNIIKSGFYSDENWGTWLKEQAKVIFKVLQLSEYITFDILFNIYNPENEKKLDIYVNNKHIMTVSSLAMQNPVSVKVPKDLIQQDNIIILDFITHGAVSPHSLNGSMDTRKLAFGIIKIIADKPIVAIPFDYDKNGFTKYHSCNFNNEKWDEYIQSNNTEKLLENLKIGLENSYLADLLIKRRTSKYSFSEDEETLHRKIWSQDLSKYKIIDKTGFQPEVFYFKNGLSFLDDEIVKKHLEKGCIIDGGACTGDSALMFAEYDFVNKIYSFEPCNDQYLNLKNTLEINNCTKAEAIKLGLCDADGEVEILGEKCETITIDTFAKDKKVGCIKLDIEGLELNTIKGAIETIKRDCPLLLICLYHTPQDFFEIKPLLESLNLGYKFKVANTEPGNEFIGVHIVLVAYKDEENK